MLIRLTVPFRRPPQLDENRVDRENCGLQQSLRVIDEQADIAKEALVKAMAWHWEIFLQRHYLGGIMI